MKKTNQIADLQSETVADAFQRFTGDLKTLGSEIPPEKIELLKEGVFVLIQSSTTSKSMTDNAGSRQLMTSIGLRAKERFDLILEEVRDVIAQPGEKIVIAYNEMKIPVRAFLERAGKLDLIKNEGAFSSGKLSKPFKTLELKGK